VGLSFTRLLPPRGVGGRDTFLDAWESGLKPNRPEVGRLRETLGEQPRERAASREDRPAGAKSPFDSREKKMRQAASLSTGQNDDGLAQTLRKNLHLCEVLPFWL